MDPHPLRVLFSQASWLRFRLTFSFLAQLIPRVSATETCAMLAVVLLGFGRLLFGPYGLLPGLGLLLGLLLLQLARPVLWLWPAPWFRDGPRTGTSLGGYFAVRAFGDFEAEGPVAGRFPFAWSEGLVYVSETCTVFEIDAVSWPRRGRWDSFRWPVYLLIWPLLVWLMHGDEQGGAWVRKLRVTVDNGMVRFGTATLLWRRVPALKISGPDYELTVAISHVPDFGPPPDVLERATREEAENFGGSS